jgi:hypothetical protein
VRKEHLDRAREVFGLPFYRDTLLAVVGGPPLRLVVDAEMRHDGSLRISLGRGAELSLAPWNLEPTADEPWERVVGATLDHELGHLLSARGLASSLLERVGERYRTVPVERRQLLDAFDAEEYFAKAFSASVHLLRFAGAAPSPGECLAWAEGDWEQRIPGVGEVVGYLVSHPAFEGHPAAAYRGIASTPRAHHACGAATEFAVGNAFGRMPLRRPK